MTKETDQQVVTRRRVAENKQNDIRLALPPKEEILALEAGTPVVSKKIYLLVFLLMLYLLKLFFLLLKIS